MIRILISILFFACLQMVTFAQEAKKNSDAPIVFIMDGSGSMWGQIDGKTKMEIARTVTSDLINKLSPSKEIGLMAYGHRHKSDCDDIETLVAPSAGNSNELIRSLNSITPVGKTPLAATAIQLIESLKISNQKATIILISDGAESCGGNLCEVIKAAKDAGVDFVLHIVGFDIGESDKLALECAAREGNGLYIDAANADELGIALEQATALTVENTEATLGVIVTKDGALHDAAIQIFRPGESKYFSALRSYNHKETNPAIFHIPTGNYNIKVVPIGNNVDPVWVTDVDVIAEVYKVVDVDFSAGNLSIRTTSNQELQDCAINIYKVGEIKSVASGRTYNSSKNNPLIKELSPGTYSVEVEAVGIKGANTSFLFKEVVVEAGKTVELEHNFELSKLSVKATNNGALWDCVLNVNGNNDGRMSSVDGGRSYDAASSNPKLFEITPGQYDVVIKPMNIYGVDIEHTISNINLAPAEEREVHYDFQTGTLEISAEYESKPWTSTVSITSGGKTVYNKRLSDYNSPQSIILSEGSYRVKLTPAKLDRPVQELTVIIKAGENLIKKVQY